MVSKVFYIIRYILCGLIGIILNKKFSTLIKFKLLVDYFRLFITFINLPFNKNELNFNQDKIFYLLSFNLKIHYYNYFSLGFLLNEIFFCSEYKTYDDLETYVDLGANIGLTMLWFNIFNPKMKIYAYEPDLLNIKVLKRNIQENKVKNCTIIQKAVSNNTEPSTFYRILDPIQNFSSGLTLNHNLPYKTFHIKTQKLSDSLKKIKKISLLKMDIEGGEYDVFEDLFLTETIDKIDKIVFESHIYNQVQEKKYLKITSLLKKKGCFTNHQVSNHSSINYWSNFIFSKEIN